MSSILIGSPISKGKVLARQSLQRALNGLETIIETYTIRTEDRAAVSPLKDVKHSDFSTSNFSYPRMAVETVNFDEENGSLTKMSVSYVGMTSSSGLPLAILRTIPTTGAGVFGPPVNIEVEFLSDLPMTEILKGRFSSLTTAQTNNETRPRFSIIRMPEAINGLKLPSNPVQPFVQEGYGSTSSSYYRYEGYIVNNIQAVQRGQFLVVTVTFSELAVSIAGVSGGWANRFGAK